MLLVANLAKIKRCKKPENYWNPGKWVLIWEYSARPFKWIPRRQGFNVFSRILHSCVLDESSLSIGRVTVSCSHQRFMKEITAPSPAADLTLPMLRLLSFKSQKRKNLWKPSKPYHVGIHWKALAEYFQMSTHLPGFQSFFRFCTSFCIGQISHLHLPLI